MSNPNDLLYEACEQHDKALYDLAIQLGATKWYEGLLGASRGGHLDLAKLMIEKGAVDHFGYVMEFAGKAGYLEIVKYLVEYGANPVYGLMGTNQGKHPEIAKYFGAGWEPSCDRSKIDVLLY